MEIEFTNLLVVVAVGFTAPLLLGLAPGLRFPAVVLEIVAGIIVGPAVLGWVEIDEPVRVLSILGLATLLFLAGLEIDYDRLRGRVARLAGGGFVLSFAIAVAVGLLLRATDTVNDALFIAIVLSATSLGVVIPVLKDSGNIETPFGQLVIAAASIADFVTIILLTLFFSEEASSTTATLLLLGAFIVLSVLLGLAILGAEHLTRLRDALRRLQDTTAQIRIRGAFVLMVGMTALATNLGLELILGSFIAGAVLKLVDRDTMMTHPQLREKLEAVGFGVFIPVFFVATGVAYDLDALGRGLDPRPGPDLPRGDGRRPRPAGAALPGRARCAQDDGRGAAAGDLAAVHRRGHRDRDRARRGRARDGRCVHRRRPALGCGLPRNRARTARQGAAGGGAGACLLIR